jgi:hypothetical protein
METTTSIIGIAQDLTTGAISRDKAIARLLDLDLPTNGNKFKNCLIELIWKLPPVPMAEDIKELELSTRYIDPFCLVYLTIRTRAYTYGGLTLEARQHDDLSIKRPDICSSRLHGMTRASNHGYGDAKSTALGDNNHSICRDLLRVGIFCKNALDEQNMEGVLGFTGYWKNGYILRLSFAINNTLCHVRAGKNLQSHLQTTSPSSNAKSTSLLNTQFFFARHQTQNQRLHFLKRLYIYCNRSGVYS